MSGFKIRERRAALGMRQVELARRAGISASYLNLIEHGRRRIAGATLLRIARALEIEPAGLAEGADSALAESLLDAAANASEPVEAERAEEFAARFPGWARRLLELSGQTAHLESMVKSLSERMEHDPKLAETLHEVLSGVTAVRTATSILVDTESLEPRWRDRFCRNLDEDSRRLADSAAALARRIERLPELGGDASEPHEALHAFFEERGFCFPELEPGKHGGLGRIRTMVRRSDALKSAAARRLAAAAMAQCAEDARRMPLKRLEPALRAHGPDPEAVAAEFGVDLPLAFRRLAALPEEIAGASLGLAICDESGAVLVRKPAQGFAMPKSAAPCAVWPLFGMLRRPGEAARMRLRQGEAVVTAFVACQEVVPARFGMASVMRPHMLIAPQAEDHMGLPVAEVGVHCRICPIERCPLRREPPVR